MSNSVLKLPFNFSSEELRRDLQRCEKYSFSPHFNTGDYDGIWTSISLRSEDGKMDNIKADAKGEFIDTELLNQCTYFKQIIDQFLCKKESIRLLNLHPGSRIKPHTDHRLGYSYGIFRIHIPITTNPKVQFHIDGQQVNMAVGETWYGDFSKTHHVINSGDTNRTHLVIDCIRNEWSDALFESLGYYPSQKEIDEDMMIQLKTIEELELMDTEFSRSLAKQIKAEMTLKKKE